MAARSGTLLDRSYRHPVDGAREPYRVYLPRGFRRGRTGRPLLVWLHGFGRDCPEPDELLTSLADEFSYVLAFPRGKGPVFYDGPGEVDVMEVVRRVRREFGALRRRTFLAGASMGGTGALRLATRYPGEFAAAVAVCGWAHSPVWYGRWYAPEGAPEEVHPAHGAALARADTLPALGNLLHVPVYLAHGGRDRMVDLEESLAAYEALTGLGCEVFMKHYARSGHRAFRRCWRELFGWLEGGPARSWLGEREGPRRARTRPKRVPDRPSEVRFLSQSPRWTRAYWAELEPADCGRPARMQLAWTGEAVSAETENVARLRLFPEGAPWEGALRRRKPPVVVRGSGRSAAGVRLSGRAGGGAFEYELGPRAGTKRPGLSGPVSDAFRDPFAVVAGRGRAGEEARAWCAAWNEALAPGGRRTVRPREVGRVTPSLMRRRHLVLFGTPEENALVRRVVRDLDAELSRSRVRLGGRVFCAPPPSRGGRAKAGGPGGGGLGVRLIVPSPLAPGRYALVFFGDCRERTKQMETLGWYWPDWVVFDGSAEPRRTVHPDWAALDEADSRGETESCSCGERELPLQYLPDSWLGAGSFGPSWEMPA